MAQQKLGSIFSKAQPHSLRFISSLLGISYRLVYIKVSIFPLCNPRYQVHRSDLFLDLYAWYKEPFYDGTHLADLRTRMRDGPSGWNNKVP